MSYENNLFENKGLFIYIGRKIMKEVVYLFITTYVSKAENNYHVKEHR